MHLRPFQAQALELLNAKSRHLLVVAATGSGKSLIFERHVQLNRPRTVLVSPLISLARQQAERFRQLGFRVITTAGGEADLPQGDSEIWITSPESLANPYRMRALTQWRPEFLVVDECHCISEWGDRFRPAFAELPELVGELSISQSLWLTATLTHSARVTLRDRIDGLVEVGDFSLPASLSVQVRRIGWTERLYFLAQWIQHHPGEGIVFCQTRTFAERGNRFLQKLGKKSAVYHAGLSQEERRAIESALRDGRLDCVVATSAFGMGMNYPRLRWVTVLQAPLTLLGLAQAIGRVARADVPGAALILWDPQDFILNRWAYAGLTNAEPRSLTEFLMGRECRRLAFARYFSESDAANDTCRSARVAACDVCIEQSEPTSLSEEFTREV